MVGLKCGMNERPEPIWTIWCYFSAPLVQCSILWSNLALGACLLHFKLAIQSYFPTLSNYYYRLLGPEHHLPKHSCPDLTFPLLQTSCSFHRHDHQGPILRPKISPFAAADGLEYGKDQHWDTALAGIGGGLGAVAERGGAAGPAVLLTPAPGAAPAEHPPPAAPPPQPPLQRRPRPPAPGRSRAHRPGRHPPAAPALLLPLPAGPLLAPQPPRPRRLCAGATTAEAF